MGNSKVERKKITQLFPGSPNQENKKLSYSAPKMVSSVKGNDPWDQSPHNSEKLQLLIKMKIWKRKIIKNQKNPKKLRCPNKKKQKKATRKKLKRIKKRLRKK